MIIRIIFDGKTYREFETKEMDDSLFSDDKIVEIKAIMEGLETVLKGKTEFDAARN